MSPHVLHKLYIVTDVRFEVFMALKIHIAVFCFVTSCSDDGGRVVLWNVGILPQLYRAS
jgi:hypothetical protein